MRGFDQFILCLLAACAALGMFTPALLAAKNRTFPLVGLSAGIGLFVIFVLISSAVLL